MLTEYAVEIGLSEQQLRCLVIGILSKEEDRQAYCSSSHSRETKRGYLLCLRSTAMVVTKIETLKISTRKTKPKAHGTHYAAFAWQNTVENITRTTNKRTLIRQKNETNGLVRIIEQSFLHIYLSTHVLIAAKLILMFLSSTM